MLLVHRNLGLPLYFFPSRWLLLLLIHRNMGLPLCLFPFRWLLMLLIHRNLGLGLFPVIFASGHFYDRIIFSSHHMAMASQFIHLDHFYYWGFRVCCGDSTFLVKVQHPLPKRRIALDMVSCMICLAFLGTCYFKLSPFKCHLVHVEISLQNLECES